MTSRFYGGRIINVWWQYNSYMMTVWLKMTVINVWSQYDSYMMTVSLYDYCMINVSWQYDNPMITPWLYDNCMTIWSLNDDCMTDTHSFPHYSCRYDDDIHLSLKSPLLSPSVIPHCNKVPLSLNTYHILTPTLFYLPSITHLFPPLLLLLFLLILLTIHYSSSSTSSIQSPRPFLIFLIILP